MLTLCLLTIYGSEDKQLALSGVFDRRIYAVRSGEERIVTLCRQKVEQYYERVIYPITYQIDLLNAVKAKDKERFQELKQKKESLLKSAESQETASGFFSGLFSSKGAKKLTRFALNCIPAVGPAISDAFHDSCAGAINAQRSSLDRELAHLDSIVDQPEAHMPVILEQLRSLDQKKKDLMEALKYDGIVGLETYYVTHQYPKGLSDEIEKLLIRSRSRLDAAPEFRKCIERALSIPSHPKRLGQTDRDYHQAFISDAIFKNYSQNVQFELFKILMNIVYSSKRAEKNNFPLREVAYFYGNPGCGKTTAAERLAKFLKLPYFKAEVRTEEDLSKTGLTGEYFEEQKFGWLNFALVAKVSEQSGNPKCNLEIPIPRDLSEKGKIYQELFKNAVLAIQGSDFQSSTDSQSYSNGFLILNDIDRLLFDSNGSSAVLAFFLEYLDTDKESFLSQYFDVPLDISRLNIIITGNTPLPKDGDPSDPSSNAFRFKALHDRLKIIEFDDMQPEIMKVIIMKHIDECASNFQYDDLSEKERATITKIITSQQEREKLSIRGTKAAISEMILHRKSRTMFPITETVKIQQKDLSAATGIPVTTTQETKTTAPIWGGVNYFFVGFAVGIIASNASYLTQMYKEWMRKLSL